MKLEEAIEIQTGNYHYHFTRITGEEKKAVGLGIEALRLLEWIRQGHIPASDFRLPGETD